MPSLFKPIQMDVAEQAPDDSSQASAAIEVESEAAQHAEALEAVDVAAVHSVPGGAQNIAPVAAQWLADSVHDRERRQQLIEQLGMDFQPYSETEAGAVLYGLKMLDDFATSGSSVRELACAATVDTAVVQETRGQARDLVGRGVAEVIGKTELTIRGASPQDVIAYLMLLDGRHFQSTINKEQEVCNEIREVKNPHHFVSYYEVKTAPFQNRTFLSSLVCQQLSDQPPTFVWVVAPLAEHPSVRPIDELHAVRAEGARCARLTLAAPNTTRIEYVCWVDLKGNFPKVPTAQS